MKGFRINGHRKQALLQKLDKAIRAQGDKGINALPIIGNPRKVTTKQISGLIALVKSL